MNQEADQEQKSSSTLIRQVVEACADCDTCRFLMDESCLFFPELYRLYDREKQAGLPAAEKDLHRLADMCTLCGLCPCSDIRAGIIGAKIARVREKGLPLSARLLSDVETAGRWGCRFPGFFNTLFRVPGAAQTVKRMAGIARDRKLPGIPKENFFSWAARKGLNRNPGRQPKIAYFAGCTAAYLFPEVARAAVAVLEHNDIGVYVPPQRCCGMPTLLEGEKKRTDRRVKKNLKSLLDAAALGCDPVCSCPTCGFFMKVLLKEGAVYSDAYQKAVNAGTDEIRIPDSRPGKGGYTSLQKSMYGKILKDNPYFSGIDPLARIKLSEKISDTGQYMESLHQQGRLDPNPGRISGRMMYFAPCHQREQNIGSPYENLLALIPGLELSRVGGAMDCCGMGGSLGFKEGFHEKSIRLGRRLAEKIRAAAPEAIVTDCLSCRLQFRHLMPEIPVFHPLEILKKAYDKKEAKND
ncbi:MAG: hypothetical protein KFF46_12045 [Desulfobacterales bacterium]|nr:hypothetical protein [Desulfobacterales bacterium]